MQRGQIWLVNLGESMGSIQKYVRPCIVVSNNAANKFSPVVHICPITSRTGKSKLPTHVELDTSTGLLMTSLALVEQSMLVTKDVFMNQVGECNDLIMSQIDHALTIQFGLASPDKQEKIIV